MDEDFSKWATQKALGMLNGRGSRTIKALAEYLLMRELNLTEEVSTHYSNSEIAAAIRLLRPDARTTPGNVAHYRCLLAARDKTVPATSDIRNARRRKAFINAWEKQVLPSSDS